MLDVCAGRALWIAALAAITLVGLAKVDGADAVLGLVAVDDSAALVIAGLAGLAGLAYQPAEYALGVHGIGYAWLMVLPVDGEDVVLGDQSQRGRGLR